MILPFVFLTSDFTLLERETHFTSVLLFVVLICSVIIGTGRINNPNFFKAITFMFLNFKAQDNSFKDSYRISQGGAFALYINFIISLTLCFFLFFFNGTNYLFSSTVSLLFVSFYLFIQQFGFRFVSIFVGDPEILEQGRVITKQIWFFSGVFFLVLSLFWILNIDYKNYFLLSFSIFLLVSIFARALKGLLFAARNRYSWYYIFLYLCTLEILPVLVVYKLIHMYLKTKTTSFDFNFVTLWQ